MNYSKCFKSVTMFVLVCFLNQLFFPAYIYALTSGPSQPEVQSFEPAGTSEMVDLFSGDFNYNIPLMDVGGYPINIAYHGGVGMDQEASWVGLGWNINPGVINRAMRGMPDDFNGDEVKKEFHIKPNITVGTSLITGAEIAGFGGDNLSASIEASHGIFYNNYKGVGYEFGFSPNISAGQKSGPSMTVGLDVNMNSQTGVDINPSLNFAVNSNKSSKNASVGLSARVGASYNSRAGLKSMTFGAGFSRSQTGEDVENNKTSRMSQGHSRGGSPLSFGTQTWMPNISMETKTANISVNTKFGAEMFAAHPYVGSEGYLSVQTTKQESLTKKAYGYMYEQNKENRDVLLDFNREKDRPFTENTTNMPLVNHTFDIYSASGHGVSGSFRLHRGDYGLLHDDYSETVSGGVNMGAEVGVGNLFHAGANLGVNFQKAKATAWEKNNDLQKGLGFRESLPGNPSYESAYFKQAGEFTPVDKTFFNNIGFYQLVTPKVSKDFRAKNLLVIQNSNSDALLGNSEIPLGSFESNLRAKRGIRNQLLYALNAKEASNFALDKQIKSTSISNPSAQLLISRNQTNGNKKEHHLSELTVLGSDGMRYIYGIPAYNTKQIEKSFAVNGTGNCQTGYVGYSVGTENTINNRSGTDQFYTSVETPAFVHSYLLSGIVSDDYVDLKNDGITDDDFGTAVKINYSRVHENFKWRTPFAENMASYVEGLKSDNKDNKGSYVYGEKEIWHVQSIESKNQIAVFTISTREDGLGVQDENGAKSTDEKAYKLDRIDLYAKQDYLKDRDGATPIKSVHFEYDYSLCPNVPNNSGAVITGNENKGKLTLKKIYFTYGKSKKGKLTPYVFEYSDYNPGYNILGHDRWGNYKPILSESCSASDPNTTNAEFPYTIQDKDSTDLYASAWSMTKVHLPSGGTIEVSYESDDYAFVQDKRAMQMFKISGFNNSNDYENKTDHLYWKSGKDEINNYVFFDLQEPITGLNADEILKKKYLEDIKDIQFTVLADIDKKDHFEYVRGYAEIDDQAGCGVTNSGNTGWFVIKPVSIGDREGKGKQVNPISRNIWNFARLNTPKLVYPFSEGDDVPNPVGMVKALLSVSQDVKRMIVGFNRSLYEAGYGQQVVTSKSWVRLNTPNNFKLGGGHRVKKIVMSDNWEEMGTGNRQHETSKYGQEYIYTTEIDNEDGTTSTISSGVASYEPTIGNEENPWHEPIITHVENKMAPDEQYMIDEPYGESFFPGAGIGYSKIKVANLSRNNVIKTATGYSISEFYTSKDFPTKVTPSKVEIKKFDPKPFWSIFEIERETKMAVTQGYLIELNDMHGKPKSQFAFSESGIKISGAKYEYQLDNNKLLNNTVLSVNKEGDIQEMDMGVEIDFYTDSRLHESETWSAGLGVNLDMFIIPTPIPITIPIPSIYPSYSKDTRSFTSLVTTKVINRSGILKKTIAFKEGSSISTENMLYDAETGSVLLTSTQNEFNENIYSQVYPAHWAYDEGMGAAYKNIGLTLTNISPGNDTIYLYNGLNPRDYLVPGDECILTNNSIEDSEIRVWVYEGGSSGKLNLINEFGTPIDDPLGTYSLKVIRSGRKNIPNTPIASVTALKNPLVLTEGEYSLEYDEVISTAAVEYSDQWKTIYGNIPYMACDSIPSKLFYSLKDLLLDMSQDSTYFEKYYYADYRPVSGPNYAYTSSKDESGYMRPVGEVEEDYLELINYNTCIYDKVGIELNFLNSIEYSSNEFNTEAEAITDCSGKPEGVVSYNSSTGKWQCVEPLWYVFYLDSINSDYLYRKDGTTYNYYSQFGTGKEIFCEDTLYVHDFDTSFLPITSDELKSCLPFAEVFHQRFNGNITLSDNSIKDSLIDASGYSNCAIINLNMIAPEVDVEIGIADPTKYKIGLICTDSSDVSSSCNFDIDCNGVEFNKIYEFIEFEVLNSNQMKTKVVYRDQCNDLDTGWVNISTDCGSFVECEYKCIEVFQTDVINPYRAGLRGNWRKKKDYTYVGERKYNSDYVDTRKDGQFKTYEPYWSFSESEGKYVPNITSNKWIWASEVTNYSPYGNEIENRDALDRYSAAVYSYNHTLPIAVASNAKYRQIAYDGFETQDYLFSPDICNMEHWSFSESASSERDATVSHSGLYSLRINSSKSEKLKSNIDLHTPVVEDISKNTEYIRHISEDIGGFYPDTGEYLFSAWVKDSVSVYDTTYDQPKVVLRFYTTESLYDSIILKSKENIIEGWQRIEEKFTIPSGTIAFEVVLMASENHCSWFDDVRIHPNKAMMKSYAYNPKNLRLMAEMDENNFATFYEYDLEGALIHVKKETIKGISTLRETRNSFKKKD